MTSASPLPKLQIRRLVTADTTVYREFRLRGFREYPDAFTSSFEEENDRPLAYTAKRLDPASTDKFWGAFSGTELVGMIGLNPETRAKNRHKASLIGMFVAPEFAGSGIGRALVNTLVAEARVSGIELIVLTVTDSNKPALTLYQKLGFTAFGTEPDAIRVNGISFGKTHMYLALSPPADSSLPESTSGPSPQSSPASSPTSTGVQP